MPKGYKLSATTSHSGAIINQRAQVLIQQTALSDWLFGRKQFLAQIRGCAEVADGWQGAGCKDRGT